MSRPGHLPASELMSVGGGHRLGLVAGRWWLRKKRQLRDRFGFAPILTTTRGVSTGAYRTEAVQHWINPSLPAYASEHCKGKAKDEYNQRAFRNIDERDYIAIARANGDEFNVAGEPWHCTQVRNTSPTGASPVTAISNIDRRRRACLLS